ncbi:DUF7673 family protein [Comamonas testosteroni]|uniref:DUF7673 family protein n=1 Tax=Comamonas testosteroni TaxID=285 RepID=UPI002DBF4C99|nr:hypothetical protein [Comamonas testosteroni]MEB5963810.1 hypothetical protein [Comamonas testosteroni]
MKTVFKNCNVSTFEETILWLCWATKLMNNPFIEKLGGPMATLSFNAFTKPSNLHYEAIAAYLQSMLNLAEGNSGQSACARRILLSIYSPGDYKMSGSDFSSLDIPHIHNAIHLLHEYGMCRKNIFHLVERGEARVLELAELTHMHP